MFLGWESCADVVQPMISPARVLPQFAAIIKLAHCLLDADCLEGAKTVADVVSSTITNLEKAQAEKLQQSDVDAYFKLILQLETNAKTSNLVRLAWFISLFPKLSPSVQCRLVLDLETQCNTHLKGVESCYLLLQDLSKSLSDNCHLYASTVFDFIEDLICCYVRLGHTEWLQSLISNICRAPPSSDCIRLSSSKKSLLDKVASSPTLWEFATSSEIGKSAMTSIVENQLSALVVNIQGARYCSDANQSNLLACINFMMRLERNPKLSDPNRISSIPSILAKLNTDQLCHLIINLHKSSSEGFNDHPSDLVIFYQICESLLSQMPGMSPDGDCRNKTFLVLKCLLMLGNESLSRSLLERMCANELVKKWGEHVYKYKLFDSLVTSTDIWGKFDLDSKRIVLNTSILLLEAWLEIMCRYMEKNHDAAAHKLKNEISCSIKLFHLIEKNRFDSEFKNVAPAFQPLFSLLPTCHLMDLVLEIHQSEAKARPNLKNFPNCLDWYRNLCKVFFDRRDLIALVSTGDLAVKIVHCLVWLGDDQSWQSFVHQFCNSFPSDQSHHFVLVFVNNFVVHRALCDSPPAISAFNRIVDHLKKPTSVLKEPPFTWEQPLAVITGHSEVQTFLRANEEKMTYQKFSSIVEARDFAAELERNGPTNGFSVRASAAGSAHNSRVIICKNKSHHYQAVKAFQVKQFELNELFKLHQNLQEELKEVDRPLSVSSQLAEEMRNISSPAKRRKVDIAEVID